MRLTKNKAKLDDLRREVGDILKDNAYPDIVKEGNELVIAALNSAYGSEMDIKNSLKEQLNDILMKNKEEVVNKIYTLGQEFTENGSRSNSRLSRSSSGSRNYSRSRSRSSFHSRSRSNSRNRPSRRYERRSRSRSNDYRRDDSRDRRGRMDNKRPNDSRGNPRNRNRDPRGNRERGLGNMNRDLINQLLNTLMDSNKTQSSTQNSMSQLIKEEKKVPEVANADRCINVIHISNKNMNILPLVNHFTQYGKVVNIKIFTESSSALIEFSTAKEAQDALKSQTPVLNDRFIEVHPFSATTGVTNTAQTTSSVATPTTQGESAPGDEVDKQLTLIRQRRMVQKQDLKNKRTSISKYLNLLRQYAMLWMKTADQDRQPQEDRLRNISQTVFKDLNDVYHLVKSGVEQDEEVQNKEGEGEAVVDNATKAQTELNNTLDQLLDCVKDTSVYADIDKQVMEIKTRALDEASHEMDIRRNAISSGFRGRARGRGRVSYRARGSRYSSRPMRTSQYQLDLRPNVVFLKNLEGATEENVRDALKDFPGVRVVSLIDQNEAKVVFEQHWQTNKPIRFGVKVNGKSIIPELSTSPYEAPPQVPTPEQGNGTQPEQPAPTSTGTNMESA